MTYAINFVNFTLAAPFQKNLGRWRGVRTLHALYGSYAHVQCYTGDCEML